MKKLPLSKRGLILNILVEGSSMRSISRIADVSINIVTKILVNTWQAAAKYHHILLMKNIPLAKRGPYKKRAA
jgi:hypothetical protein